MAKKKKTTPDEALEKAMAELEPKPTLEERKAAKEAKEIEEEKTIDPELVKEENAKALAEAIGISLEDAPEGNFAEKKPPKKETNKTYNVTATQVRHPTGMKSAGPAPMKVRMLREEFPDVDFQNGGTATISTVIDVEQAARLRAFLEAQEIASNNTFIRDMMRDQANMAAGSFLERVRFPSE